MDDFVMMFDMFFAGSIPRFRRFYDAQVSSFLRRPGFVVFTTSFLHCYVLVNKISFWFFPHTPNIGADLKDSI